MSPELITALAGLVTAIGGVIAIVLHVRGHARRPPR